MEENLEEICCTCPECGGDKNINGFIKNRLPCRLCINLKMRQYKAKNKEAISNYNKEYKLTHKDDISVYNSQYNKTNRKQIQERHTKYLREKRKTDPNYKMGTVMRNRVNKVLNGQKKTKTLKMLGCSFAFLTEWLEFQFDDTMTFKNHGPVWHVDHIVPCHSFDLTNESELLECFNWSNLRPYDAHDNMSKKANVIPEEITQNQKNILKFLAQKGLNVKDFNLPDKMKFIQS